MDIFHLLHGINCDLANFVTLLYNQHDEERLKSWCIEDLHYLPCSKQFNSTENVANSGTGLRQITFSWLPLFCRFNLQAVNSIQTLEFWITYT